VVGTTPEIDRWINDFGERLSRRLRVDRILLFGSRARCAALHESDVDLAVVSPDFESMSWIARAELLAREWGYGPDADCLGFTPAELERATNELTFPGQIRKTGVVVFPRPIKGIGDQS
jgi:predicted nucleotidyltransferase